jgi:hypothetical protein
MRSAKQAFSDCFEPAYDTFWIAKAPFVGSDITSHSLLCFRTLFEDGTQALCAVSHQF